MPGKRGPVIVAAPRNSTVEVSLVGLLVVILLVVLILYFVRRA